MALNVQQLGNKKVKAAFKSLLLFPKELLFSQYYKSLNWKLSNRLLIWLGLSSYLIAGAFLGFIDATLKNIIFSFIVLILLLNYNLPIISNTFQMNKFKSLRVNVSEKNRFILWLILYFNPFVTLGILFALLAIITNLFQGNYSHFIDILVIFIFLVQKNISEICNRLLIKTITSIQIFILLLLTFLHFNFFVKYLIFIISLLILCFLMKKIDNILFQITVKINNAFNHLIAKTLLYSFFFSNKKEKVFILIPALVAAFIAQRMGASFSPAITLILMLLVQYEIMIDNQLEEFEETIAKIKFLKAAKISYLKRFVSTIYFKLSIFSIISVVVINYFFSSNFIIPTLVEVIYILLMSMYYYFFLERELLTHIRINSFLREFLPITAIFTFFIF